MDAAGSTGFRPPDPARVQPLIPPSVRAAVSRWSARTRIASNTRRNTNDCAMLTTVNSAPIFRFCASVVCNPNTGKIRICVTTATL
jgi:hypothetical protein